MSVESTACNVRFSLFLKRASTLPSCQWKPHELKWVTGVTKIAQIVMVIPMHLSQSQLLLYQRNRCFPEATLILISRRRSRYNVPRSGAVPRSVDVPRSGLFPDLVIKCCTKLEAEEKGRSAVYKRSSVKFQDPTGQKMADFDPNCNSSLNPPMVLKCPAPHSRPNRNITLVPKFEKHPRFANFGRKKTTPFSTEIADF